MERADLANASHLAGPEPRKVASLLPRAFAVPVIALLLLFGTDLYGADETAAEAHSEKGLQLAHAGDLAGAEAELRAAVALAPQNPEFLSSLATVLAMEKKLEDSTNTFKHALKLDPANVMARRYLAANLWQLHRYTEAKQNLELILKQNSNDQASRLLLGMVAENMQDYGTAVKMLASVPGEVRKQPESIAALAVSYYKIGEKQKARHTLEGLQNHPAGTRAVLLGAQIADDAGDYEIAEQLLASMRSNYPDQADLDYRMAAVQYHEQKFSASEQTLLHLIASGNRTGRILNLLGWCYQKQSQSELAMRAFEDGISVEPSEESNYLDLQKILLANHRLAGALEVTKRTTDALPNSARAFVMRGSIEMQTSQFTNAVASYRRAKKLDPVGADAALGLADAELAAGMSKESHTDFDAGITQFPKDARFRLHYALALLKESETGDPLAQARAEELLTSAVKLDPSSVEAHYQLGELALKNGHTAEALRDYETAARLDPQNAKAHFGLSKTYRRLGRTEDASREEKLFQKLQESNSAATLSSTEGTQK
jgi:tetratricopeptide (TPR) repeat protein